MKKMRIPLLIALGVALLGLIFGSFFDLAISAALGNPSNAFALTISAICPTIGFAGVAMMGGAFIAFAIKGKYHIALKILFYVLAACCLGVAIYYPAGEYFGVNGFYHPSIKWVGYLIVLLPEAGAMVGGYFLFKDFQNKNMWIVLCIMIVLLLIALMLVLPQIKDNMHRPRYRFLLKADLSYYHNWWQPCKEYKELIETYGVNSDDFKSFPSGHTAETSILLVCTTFLPLINKKFEKVQLPLFIGSCCLVVLVAFARILAGAHYLSDVSMGALIILILLFIANEVVANIKALQIKEEKLPF